MKKFFILALAVATTLSVTVPAQAFPSVNVPQVHTSDVEQVRDRQIIRRNNWHGDQTRSNRNWNRHSRNDRGHHSNNVGAIIGGLAVGAIIGGALSSQNGTTGSCASRYRSYRASDNTYQPFNGPRQQCR